MLICIDAGHGGYDSGAVYGKYIEKNICLETAIKLKETLERCGFKVVLTRKDDTYVPLQDRCNTANYKNADLFISIHVNSTKNANGTETFVHSSRPSKAVKIAGEIQRSMVDTFGTRDRGVKDSDFKVLRSTHMTAILTECGFIESNDMSKINAINYAESVAKGICKSYSVPYVEDKKPLYRVCVGTYKDINNAKMIVNEAKMKGFTGTFIAEYRED